MKLTRLPLMPIFILAFFTSGELFARVRSQAEINGAKYWAKKKDEVNDKLNASYADKAKAWQAVVTANKATANEALANGADQKTKDALMEAIHHGKMTYGGFDIKTVKKQLDAAKNIKEEAEKRGINPQFLPAGQVWNMADPSMTVTDRQQMFNVAAKNQKTYEQAESQRKTNDMLANMSPAEARQYGRENGLSPKEVQEMQAKALEEKRRQQQAAINANKISQDQLLAGMTTAQALAWGKENGLSRQEVLAMKTDAMATIGKQTQPNTAPAPSGGSNTTQTSNQYNTTNSNCAVIDCMLTDSPWAQREAERLMEIEKGKLKYSKGALYAAEHPIDDTQLVTLVNQVGNSQDIDLKTWNYLQSLKLITNSTYTNGINTFKSEGVQTASDIAQALGGTTTLVYNPTHAEVAANGDINNTVMRFVGSGVDYLQDTVACQMNMCRESATNILRDMLRLTDGNLFMTAHSQGTTILSNAIDRYIGEGGDVSRTEVIAAGAVDSINTKVKTHYVYETNESGDFDMVANPGKAGPFLRTNLLGIPEMVVTATVINGAKNGLFNADYTRINSGAACSDAIGMCHSSTVIAEYLKLAGAVAPTWVASDGRTHYGNVTLTRDLGTNQTYNASYYCVEKGNCISADKAKDPAELAKATQTLIRKKAWARNSLHDLKVTYDMKIYDLQRWYPSQCKASKQECDKALKSMIKNLEQSYEHDKQTIVQGWEAKIRAHLGTNSAVANGPSDVPTPSVSLEERNSVEQMLAAQRAYNIQYAQEHPQLAPDDRPSSSQPVQTYTVVKGPVNGYPLIIPDNLVLPNGDKPLPTQPLSPDQEFYLEFNNKLQLMLGSLPCGNSPGTKAGNIPCIPTFKIRNGAPPAGYIEYVP